MTMMDDDCNDDGAENMGDDDNDDDDDNDGDVQREGGIWIRWRGEPRRACRSEKDEELATKRLAGIGQKKDVYHTIQWLELCHGLESLI